MNRVLSFVVLFTVVLFAVNDSSYLALGQHKVSQPGTAATDVDKWKLRVFEATLTGDPSICNNDQYCVDHTRYLRSLICIINVCEGKDKNKNSAQCAKAFADQYSKEMQEQISASLCALTRSPDAVTRQKYLSLVVDEKEDEVVEEAGYILALKGSAASCEGYIKNFVGAYGPQWTFQWYRALAGCRILAGQTTREQEEKYFITWSGVTQGAGHCSDIVNNEVKQACSARQAASPAPVYKQLW